jgi:hypothetical protein
MVYQYPEVLSVWMDKSPVNDVDLLRIFERFYDVRPRTFNFQI